MSTSQQAAAATPNVNLLEQSKQRSRAAEKARLENAQLAREQAIAAAQQRIAELRAQQEAVPKTGQIQQGFKQEKGNYAGFVTNHKPVYVMNNVPNFIPDYTESERQQVNAIFGQIVEEQKKLDKLIGVKEPTKLQEPQYLTPDTRTGPNATSIDYAGTLAARQAGFNVGSGLVSGLEPTFEKEQQKQFAEHNKQINLTENITTEKARQVEQNVVQPPAVQPQNPRPHILTGQPASEYANPAFAQKGSAPRQGIKESQPASTGSIHTILGLEENISTTPAPKNFAVSLFEGTPPKPKELTQEQVNALTPAEYAAYRKDFEVYNQYVNSFNEKLKAQKKSAILANREVFFENRKALADYIDQAKKEGIEYVTIQTSKGYQTIPISQALQKRGIIGISAVPNIPEGYTLTGMISEPVLFPEGKQLVGPVKPEQPDYLKNIGSLFGTEALAAEEKLPVYYNEPGRVRSGEKLIASKSLGGTGPIISGIENLKSPFEKAGEYAEGVGTGILRTSLAVTNAFPQAVIDIAKTKNPLAGEQTLKEHEESLRKIGLGPSVLPSIETGAPTGRSPYYNIGEATGEILPLLAGLSGIKNPFARSPIKPKIEKAVPQTEAPEIAKSPLGIKAYPGKLTRDQGFGERPTLERGLVPKEEAAIKKAFTIPEPLVQEAGTTRGARDYGNLREQIANVKKPLSETENKPVEPEAFYTPKVEVRRAPEPNTFRVDESAMFGKDTATTVGKTEVPLGEGSLVKVEESKGPLGGSIIKSVVAAEPFKTEYVPLGAGRVKEVRLNLGKGKTETALGKTETNPITGKKEIVYQEQTKGTITDFTGKSPGSEIEFGQVPEEEAAMFKPLIHDVTPELAEQFRTEYGEKIFINRKMRPDIQKEFESPEHTADILTHETMHGALEKIAGFEAGANFDNLFYNRQTNIKFNKLIGEEIPENVISSKGEPLRFGTQITPGLKPQIFKLSPEEFAPSGEINLGKGKGKTVTPFGELNKVELGKGEILKESQPTFIETDTTYSSTKNLPKTRAKEIKTYRIQTDQLIGRTENPLKDIFAKQATPLVRESGLPKVSIKETLKKVEAEKEFPQLFGGKAFERSAADAERRRFENQFKFTKTAEIPLGKGLAERVPARPPPARFVGLGRGRTFFVSRSTGESGVKRFTPPKSPPPDEGATKGGLVQILEKPTETKGFTSTKVELGTSEKVGIIGAGGAAVAPAPLLILAETDENSNPITNTTETNGTITNGTETLPGIIEPPQEIDLTPSTLEPSSITETRPEVKFGAAVSTPSGLAYGINALNARRSGLTNKVEVTPVTKTRQREAFGFPNPSKQPSRLAQPAAFRQPQKEREREIFGTPFPNPQQPGLKTPTPFPQPEKLKQPEPLFPKPPREPPISNFKFTKPRESRKEKARKDKLDAFVGNVSDVDIALGFNRREITPGVKASAKRYKKDIQFAYKRGGFKKLITQHEGSVLSKKKRSILEREKPKEVKKQKRKTGGFF